MPISIDIALPPCIDLDSKIEDTTPEQKEALAACGITFGKGSFGLPELRFAKHGAAAPIGVDERWRSLVCRVKNPRRQRNA